jgi:hypothetical protein
MSTKKEYIYNWIDTVCNLFTTSTVNMAVTIEWKVVNCADSLKFYYVFHLNHFFDADIAFFPFREDWYKTLCFLYSKYSN